MRKTREERKNQRSAKASRAVRARWDKYHADLVAAGIVEIYDDPRPADMYRITAENLMTGKTHTLLLHPGPRNDNFRIDLDGVPWKVSGFTGIVAVLRKGLVRSKPGRIF